MKDFSQKVLSFGGIMKNLSFLAIVSFFVLLNSNNAQAQLFTQDFSGSTTVSDYVNATNPNNGQFNAIGTANANTTVSINSGSLQFNRTTLTGGTGSFSRTTDFNPVPTSLIYKVDITVSGNTTAQTTAAVFQVGSGFRTTNSAEANANVYARFGVNLSATNGCFLIRDLTALTNSAEFCGTQTITFVLNNTGGTLSYTAPDGTTQTIANDTQDIYVGTTLVFNDAPVTTPTQSITDLKFAFTAGIGTIQLDNLLINQIPAGPSAAGASLSGRVATESGRGIWRATLVLTGGTLEGPVYAVTDFYGNYNFNDIPAGETYALSVFVKGYKFNQTSIVVNLNEDVTDAHFIGTPKQRIGGLK